MFFFSVGNAIGSRHIRLVALPYQLTSLDALLKSMYVTSTWPYATSEQIYADKQAIMKSDLKYF